MIIVDFFFGYILSSKVVFKVLNGGEAKCNIGPLGITTTPLFPIIA